MLMAGVAVSDVSQAFGCTRQNSHKLRTGYVHIGTVRDRQRPGYLPQIFMSICHDFCGGEYLVCIENSDDFWWSPLSIMYVNFLGI